MIDPFFHDSPVMKHGILIFDQDFYDKFNTFIVENPGMTAEEYADSIDFL